MQLPELNPEVKAVKSKLRNLFAISLAFLFFVTADLHGQSPQLDLLTDPELVLGFSETAPVQVRFSGPDGPIAGAAIGFTPLSDTADAYLSQLRDITGAGGVAETSITGGDQEVDFGISISVPDDDTVEPVTVRVRVTAIPGLAEARYPGDFSSMQEAVDALADGGILSIAPGIHEMEPTFIRGKTVHIEGSGPNCYIPGSRNGWTFGTVLVSPKVDRVTAPDEVQGSLHYIDAGGSISNLRMTGGDAPVATRGTGRDPGRPLTVSNTCLTHAVRGIHHKAASPLTVVDTLIRRMAWNGISIAPLETDEEVNNTVINSTVFSVAHYCIFAMGSGNSYVTAIEDVLLVDCGGGATGGGGIGVSQSLVSISNSDILSSYTSGIWLRQAAGVLEGNLIFNTNANPYTDTFGDAIVALLSPMVILEKNTIWFSDRSGVANFGSHMELEDNSIKCPSFDLEWGDYLGSSGIFVDNGGNQCGCPPFINEACLAQSIGFEPPDPPAPIE